MTSVRKSRFITHALWIAPKSFKSRVLEYLDREIEKGENGRVTIKVNAMNNRDVMRKLIECSQAGVKVELFIRGICCLRPGVPGMTENITVRSVVGRFLEHSRIYRFGSGDDERTFLGSGDLLNRNLERRVEAFIEVKTPETRAQIDRILDALRSDREKSRTMQPDGSYLREEGGAGTSSQDALYRYFSGLRLSLADPVPEPELTAPELELELPEPEITAPEPEAEVSEPEPEVSEPEILVSEPEITAPDPGPEIEKAAPSEPAAELVQTVPAAEESGWAAFKRRFKEWFA